MMTPLIDIYATRLRAAGRSPYTISTRCRVLRQADRSMPNGLVEATPDDIIDFLADRQAAWSRSTCYAHLHGFYTAMVAAERMLADPTDRVDRPKCGDRIADPVSNHHLSIAIADSPDLPWRLAVVLAAYAGLRCCEICGLLREDVTEEHVHVRHGKGDKGRYIPTHPLVWAQVAHRPAGPLVLSARGRPITPERLSGAQHQHWVRVGLPGFHLHQGRAWFATTLADQGVGIEVIQELMGHARIETTRGYMRVSVVRQRAALLSLPITGAPAGL